MRWTLFVLVALAGCGNSSAHAPTDTGVDVGVDEEDADADVIPTLLPSRCKVPMGCESRWRDVAPKYAPIASDFPFVDRAFYVFTLLAKEPTLRADLDADATLAAIANSRDAALRNALKTCTTSACLATATTWSASDVAAARDAILSSLTTKGHLATWVAHLRKSGIANAHLSPDCSDELDDGADLARAAWTDAITAASNGVSSHTSAPFAATVTELQKRLATKTGTLAPFEPALFTLWSMLAAEKSDEAVRYEPLAAGENAKAVAALATIDWKSFPFTMIVVPGLGPTDLSKPLSDGGRDRCDLALVRWQAKLAPLIVTSGGHVHPDRTPYSEAIEMKKYLLSKGVPEAALLVDPYARHTTTNLRNVTRVASRHGVPIDRPMLVTTDWGQTLYMNDQSFNKRCAKELGFSCTTAMTQLSNFDSCVYASAVSLQQDPRDLLDP